MFDWRFPGQVYDAETGVFYNYFRDYEPGVGRYFESDSIGLNGGINIYVYAENNPLLYTDKLGESAVASLGGWFGADLSIPDPTDAAFHKWFGYCFAFAGAYAIDILLSENQNNQGSAKDKKRFFDKGQKDRARDRSRDRDGDATCEYCGVKTTNERGKPNSSQIDHVKPWAKGGKTDDSNSANSCQSCNASKGAKELGTEWIPPKQR